MNIKRYSLSFILIFSVTLMLLFITTHLSFNSNITYQKVQELGLPVLSIHTENYKKINSKEKYLSASFSLDNQEFNGKIRGRGNSTWVQRKKPYLIKFDSDISLLGLKPNKKWVLLADITDRTKLRNSYTTYLASAVFDKTVFVPQYTRVNVFINNKYEGLYTLYQKIDLDTFDLDEKKETIFKIDTHDGKKWYFYTDGGLKVSLINDDSEKNDYEFYKKSFIAFDELLFSKDFKSKQNGYCNFIDTDSFIDWYLINEFGKNHDANFFASCYIYFNRVENKFYMGPLWDFDISYGGMNRHGVDNPQGFWINQSNWYKRLFEDPEFVQKVKNRWLEKSNELEESFKWLDKEAQNIKSFAEYDDYAWRVIGWYQWPPTKGWIHRHTYQDEVHYLMNWLKERKNFLDDYYKSI